VVRVAYRFRVDPARMEEFRAAWREATEIVRRTRDGAHGSSLLVDTADPTQVLLLALWESRDHWQRSRDARSAAPAQEEVMLAVGRPEGVTVYDVVDDLTGSAEI
jgi:quinol monooxygenase YgiN